MSSLEVILILVSIGVLIGAAIVSTLAKQSMDHALGAMRETERLRSEAEATARSLKETHNALVEGLRVQERKLEDLKVIVATQVAQRRH